MSVLVFSLPSLFWASLFFCWHSSLPSHSLPWARLARCMAYEAAEQSLVSFVSFLPFAAMGLRLYGILVFVTTCGTCLTIVAFLCLASVRWGKKQGGLIFFFFFNILFFGLVLCYRPGWTVSLTPLLYSTCCLDGMELLRILVLGNGTV
ncbi:hypothetical protein B0I37DRAFT_382745 [Chaetomium sp. MPI-CAGE-AT-0009]|nr:hypothetical protein B0I37DRAFT_382745 [Chaetomium sp. MPI-CAGE-AT-0009]